MCISTLGNQKLECFWCRSHCWHWSRICDKRSLQCDRLWIPAFMDCIYPSHDLWWGNITSLLFQNKDISSHVYYTAGRKHILQSIWLNESMASFKVSIDWGWANGAKSQSRKLLLGGIFWNNLSLIIIFYLLFIQFLFFGGWLIDIFYGFLVL